MVKVGFQHDGFAKMRLFIDVKLVGESVADGPIPSVQGAGVSIGNEVDADDRQFPGEIDELKIWRLDPKMMKRELLGRPFEKATAKCWGELIRAILKWKDGHPESFRDFAIESTERRNRLLRAVYLLPDNEQAKLRAAMAVVTKLWSTGDMSGHPMAKALDDFVALLRSYGINPWSDIDQILQFTEIAIPRIDGSRLVECEGFCRVRKVN